MKRATNPSPRSRPRKKAAAPKAVPMEVAEASIAAPEPAAASTGVRNVGEMEGVLSVGMGILFIIAALFPRSVKQLVMLSLGGGLLYRGMTGHCGVYQAMDIDNR